MKQTLAFILSIAFVCTCCNRSGRELSRSVTAFENKSHSMGLSSFVFYPSTIRMLNTEKDSLFNVLIKDIQKLKIISNNNEKDTIQPEPVQELVNNIRKERFVDLMQMQQDSRQIMIFLQKSNHKPREFIGIIRDTNSLVVIDLLGNIPITLLPSLINGNIKFPGFTKVLNTNKTNRQRQHEQHPRN